MGKEKRDHQLKWVGFHMKIKAEALAWGEEAPRPYWREDYSCEDDDYSREAYSGATGWIDYTEESTGATETESTTATETEAEDTTATETEDIIDIIFQEPRPRPRKKKHRRHDRSIFFPKTRPRPRPRPKVQENN